MRIAPKHASVSMLLVGWTALAAAAPIPSLRNLRYWASDRLPIQYETDATGDPRITDGSDYVAIDQAFAEEDGRLGGLFEHMQRVNQEIQESDGGDLAAYYAARR